MDPAQALFPSLIGIRFIVLMQVWKYSKISAHEEIARGAVLLPARELQGGQSWDQRVTLQPTRFGKGSALGGEVLLKLHFTSVQVGYCTDFWALNRSVFKGLRPE